ncbi:PREDICTED: putative tyrosine-protein kinase Wsck [Polistes canadensis]|uniref:putative tyrosine-protein kinase Wsck n=1 Tax=Polistes canadensis TaxID=91411 RepID=UPI000718EFDF|nr:PREDICTED: putative tyrosine-protein kinase Wsck [Polistes canadensis]
MAAIILLFYINVVLGQEYEGCFKSPAEDPDLSSLISSRITTPIECIEQCHSYDHMFAGLQNGQRCYCGSKFGKNGLSDACNILCTADTSKYCGGQEAMSIYSTGQKGPSRPRVIQIIPQKDNNFLITWQPPDISNGNITSYTLTAVAIKTYAYNILPPIESQVQGGTSNNTILRGLQPGTKYNISISASNSQGISKPAYATEWTSIGPPDKPITPKILNIDKTTITVMLSEGSSENGPVSAYQVVVVQPGIISPVGSDVMYFNYEKSFQEGLGYYITAEFDASDFHNYKKFVVGDGRLIGGYYNAPLKIDSMMPQIGLVVISKAQREVQYSYSNFTNSIKESQKDEFYQMDPDAIVFFLRMGIIFLGSLLIISMLIFYLVRRHHEKAHIIKLPEQQELTLQGPLHEVDNMGYIPEDIPERVNHYQELKNKVWSIPQSSLSINNAVLCRGRFGTVHSGTVQKDEQTCSVVIHTIADRSLKPSEKQAMLRELDICIKASTMMYLAGLVGTCETSDTLYVVLEMPPQLLKHLLLSARSGTIFPVDKILPIGSSIASALKHLENYKIVHTHLCARSIGITNDWIPKVMGHGIAKYILEDINYARWRAIECFTSKKKHQPGVVWAFGVLLWEMLSMGGTPYSNLSFDSEVEEAIEQGIRLPQLPDTPDPLYEVMLSCWQVDPEERPTFDELERLNTLSICPITAYTEPYIPELEVN